MDERRVLCLRTGGTIGGRSTRAGRPVPLRRRDLRNVRHWMASEWGLDVEIDVRPTEWQGRSVDIDSTEIDPEDWTGLASRIGADFDHYDGFVVLHGTNTMAYSACAVSFAIANSGKPIIFTGSQIPLGVPGSDALANIENSIKLAMHPQVDVGGVVCVFGSQVLTGTRAKKVTDFDLDAITTVGSSASLGRVGRTLSIDEANLVRHQSYIWSSGGPAHDRRSLDLRPDFAMKDIASVTEFPGLSLDRLVRSAHRGRVRGVVFRAFGTGDVNEEHRRDLEVLRELEVPVVIGTQIPNGNADFSANEPGRAVQRRRLGIPAHDMSIEAMTTKLGWLLAQGVDHERMQLEMIRDLRGEITVDREVPW